MIPTTAEFGRWVLSGWVMNQSFLDEGMSFLRIAFSPALINACGRR
jgi:hypothetical protein